jgi:hypothetical protein
LRGMWIPRPLVSSVDFRSGMECVPGEPESYQCRDLLAAITSG